MTDQISIPTVFMRGGTSKGLLFDKRDLPTEEKKLTQYLLAAMGSPDTRQIDGMGGATSVTSKVCIISKSELKNIDIDYFFAQVLVDEARVDYGPTCGNMLSAVGPFAIEKGLINAKEAITTIVIRSVNTGSIIEATIETPNKKVKYSGDYKIAGVPGEGSPILLKFKNLVGGVTGKLLPTDYPTSIIDGIEVTCLDVSMPIVMANAKDFGISGNETSNFLNQNKTLLKKIEEVRLSAALEMGMGDVSGKVIPKFALLSKPLNGGTITSRYFTPKTCHETHAATGTNCIAAACLIPNTVASEITKIKASGNDKITIEHPLGLIDCLVETSLTGGSFDKDFIKSCGIYRTSRKIMDGNVYIPENIDDD
ncbi:4-oxalomesaconate tautomerase [Alphaproteobacteria bacterium]|nr:4-oxalomesaconate tautomerase [Alphaproteobacteria bacterium]